MHLYFFVASSHLLLTGFVSWLHWRPSVPITTQTVRPRLEVHVAWSRHQGTQCGDTFSMLLAPIRCPQPLWEVLGDCRLFVACGDWSYRVWRDVTWSLTPLPVIHANTTHTHTHTVAFALCFSPGWSELFISLSTSAASREMLSLGHYKSPQAVENVLTDTGQTQGPACCCLHAAVSWCFRSDLHFPASDILHSTWWNHGIANPRPNRMGLFWMTKKKKKITITTWQIYSTRSEITSRFYSATFKKIMLGIIWNISVWWCCGFACMINTHYIMMDIRYYVCFFCFILCQHHKVIFQGIWIYNEIRN